MLALGVAVLFQLAYPTSRALPQTNIAGQGYGYKTKQQITADIAARQQRTMTITAGDQTLRQKPGELGVTLQASKDAAKVVEYSWRERLVPFSFLWERREVTNYSIQVDEKQAQKFAATLSKYDQKPVDAAVRLEGSKVVVGKHQNGYSYNLQTITDEIKGLKLNSAMVTTVQPETTYPTLTDDMATAAATQAQQRLQQPIEVRAADKKLTASAEQIASWIEFKPVADGTELRLEYNKDKIRQWLDQLAGQVYIASRPSVVTMLDGTQTGASAGADGRALSVDATINAVASAAYEGRGQAEGQVQPVKPAAQVNRNYSRSSAGLQALLNYWDESHGGTWGVVLRQTDGSITANLNAGRQFTSASVYKLYVAYVVYQKLDSGEITMQTATDNGKNVDVCLDIMITRSDNACAVALGNMIGWDANNGMLHAKGFGSTSIAYGGQLTTPQDVANYLGQLQSGSLMAAGNRDALLHKMSNNIYRYAIPAATPGIASANKLGAAGVFNHDAAIVYHPKGTYVLVVMTQGSNHGEIRELARQIASVMGQ